MNKLNPLAVSIFASATVLLGFGTANSQIQSAGGGYYVAGYGTVYGSFGQASAAQSRMYDQMKTQKRRTDDRNALIDKWGLAAVEKAERERASGARPSNTGLVVPAPPVVRNYGLFRPDQSVDTSKMLGDVLADTPEDKALIKRIYLETKSAYDKEAAARGWQNNIAGGLTFFTATALTVYRGGEQEPSDQAANNYFKLVNASLDEIPEFASIANKEKQGFNNMLVGFSGLLLAGYTEGKQQNNAATLASYSQLAGVLIKLVLRTDPENLRLENGQIVVR